MTIEKLCVWVKSEVFVERNSFVMSFKIGGA